MENIEKKKGNTGLIVLVVILILIIVGLVGFGIYKYMDFQNENNSLKDQNKSLSENLNKQKVENNQIKKETSTNDYSLFVENMKKNRKEASENLQIWGTEMVYLVTLDSKGVLKAGDQVSKKEVAKNVLFFKSADDGHNEYRSLYYVTEDGKVYKAEVESGIVNKEKFKVQLVKGVSNVANIISSYDVGVGSVAFVDINGNIQEGSIN